VSTMKPKPVLPKNQRQKRLSLDELERLETEDWIGDIRRREWKKSQKYQEGLKLLERYAKK